MPFYRRKPQIVEATLIFSYAEMPAVVGWIEDCGGKAVVTRDDGALPQIKLNTASGVVTAFSGDYIVRTTQRHFIAMKPGDFHELYERV